ncbi:WXG100 family type VII secretion target [Solwaraspora sp. WMMD406]|uniref:WXG100 family type VII secretion target n=1 Tax=Solwaraspora sp. WMMD406 TaxID=3016095 RepID=UPI002416F801|nr:WXG100 family type VII secretion target [Solwaraspora sp. WMMD406]MDG4762748.1 WXG100 family type VII secretion target [Solwaraspora sp. WMMD406]
MEIRYNFAALNGAADNCKNASGNMVAELDNLKTGIQPLVATWEGDAQEAYLRRQTEWEAAADSLKDLLGRIENALRESAIRMQAREAANRTKFE